MLTSTFHAKGNIQDAEQLVQELITLGRSWWTICFDFFYQLFYGILEEHTTQWITIDSCEGISTILAWLITTLLFFIAGLFIVQTLGKLLRWAIDLIFVQSITWLKRLITEILKRALQTLWFLITFIPRSIWRSITGKQ